MNNNKIRAEHFLEEINKGEKALRSLRYKFHQTRLTSDFHANSEDFYNLLRYVDLLRDMLGDDIKR